DTAKLCINGHEYAKQQLTAGGIRFEALDNGVLRCDAPQRLQQICDGLSAGRIEAVMRGGGWAGKSRWSLASSILMSVSGCVYRGRISQRPSAVGTQTSIICMLASLSNTAVGVRPGAWTISRCLSVT